MTRRQNRIHGHSQRTRIAGTAARLIAEDGINDFSSAKRKAARRLGLPETAAMPGDSEVEVELRAYQRLFQEGEQGARVAWLRRKAAEIMADLQPFAPYLTGSVLNGTAGRYAEIDLQIFADSSKDVEIYLLNQRIDYEHSTPRNERAEAVLVLRSDGVIVNLVIYPVRDERVAFKTPDGRVRERARLAEVLRMLETPA